MASEACAFMAHVIVCALNRDSADADLESAQKFLDHCASEYEGIIQKNTSLTNAQVCRTVSTLPSSPANITDALYRNNYCGCLIPVKPTKAPSDAGTGNPKMVCVCRPQ